MSLISYFQFKISDLTYDESEYWVIITVDHNMGHSVTVNCDLFGTVCY